MTSPSKNSSEESSYIDEQLQSPNPPPRYVPSLARNLHASNNHSNATTSQAADPRQNNIQMQFGQIPAFIPRNRQSHNNSSLIAPQPAPHSRSDEYTASNTPNPSKTHGSQQTNIFGRSLGLSDRSQNQQSNTSVPNNSSPHAPPSPW
jgi:Tfp pilus assembly protein PilE